MQITRNNYEEYALDYLEQRLGAAERERFLQFLDANPDLKSELDVFQMVHIPVDESVRFSEPSRLYRQVRVYSRRMPLWWSLAAAATAAMIFLIGKTVYQTPQGQVSEMITIVPEEQETLPTEHLPKRVENPPLDATGAVTSHVVPSKEALVYDERSLTGSMEIKEHSITPQIANPVVDLTPVRVKERIVESPVDLLPAIPVRDILSYKNGVEEISSDLIANHWQDKSGQGEKWLEWFAEKTILPAFIRDLDKETIKEALVPQYLVTN